MYKELELDFEIPEDMQDIITEYLDYLKGNGYQGLLPTERYITPG